MTDLETAIMIKNMARETVRRMSAKVKNAQQFKHGDKVIVDGKYEGVVQEVKAGYYEVRIFDGSRVVGTRVVWPKDIAARNATGKNATTKNDKSFKEQMDDTDIIGWKSLLSSIKLGKTKASDYEKGLTDAAAIKILEAKIALHKSFYR